MQVLDFTSYAWQLVAMKILEILKFQAVAGKNSCHNELVVYIHSASYFSFSRHYTLAVAIWADELTLVVNYHSRSETHLGAQEVWLLSMTGSWSRTN